MKITAKQAVRLLRQAVKFKGRDYVSPECKYVVTNFDYDENNYVQAPGCVVGTALHIAGVPLDALAKSEGRIEERDTVRRLREHGDVEMTKGALRIFAVAQIAQDGRDRAQYDRIVPDLPNLNGDKQTWGEAVSLAVGKH